MKYKIGVMGKAGRSKELPEDLRRGAEEVGREIAKKNCVLVTGACMGVPQAAAEAASDEGGLILGFSPAKNIQEHIEPPISYPQPPKNMELIFTGYGKVGRNVLSIFECDGVICVGGGMGTLNEFSVAAHEGKVIGVLEGLGGFIESLPSEIESQVSEKGGAVLIKDKNPKALVGRVIEEIEKRNRKPKTEIPLTFPNKEGEQLAGVLHLPGVNKPPLVFLIHGFGGTKSRRRLVRLARALQKEGIAVFRFDFSGCGDSQGELEEVTTKKEVGDLGVAVRAVFKEADVDRSRIAFVAESFGAPVSVLYKNQTKIFLKTMVFLAPAFCQKELIRIWQTEESLKEWEEKGYSLNKDKKLGIEYLKENKDTDYTSSLDEVDLPMLIIHGKEDEVVPIRFSEEIERSFENVELVKVNNDHRFEDNYFEQQKMIGTVTDWIKKYLF